MPRNFLLFLYPYITNPTYIISYETNVVPARRRAGHILGRRNRRSGFRFPCHRNRQRENRPGIPVSHSSWAHAGHNADCERRD